MARRSTEDETILRIAGVLPLMLVMGLAGLALVDSLDAAVGLSSGMQGAASYAVVLLAFVVAGVRARHN